jgi:putative addiction module component (TIGR02574 family)
MKPPKVDIAKLSAKDRLRLIEDLWESLSDQPDNVPITDAQRQELDRRLDGLEGGGTDGIPWEDVLKQLRRRRS